MRRYQPAASADKRSLQDAPPFLINRPAVVYYRQSSAQQIGNTSTALQLIDLPNYLQSRGWVRQDILIIDDDAGVSGSLPIDHRIGMSKLLDLIVSGKIGTVACQQVDRLFRDPTQIEVNRFIDACSKANVRVLTPVIQYDFTGPNGFQMARQFRFEAELAAEFHYSMVQARLQSGRQYFAQQGCWIGGSVPVGFILDQRRRLPDGSANPLWRKLVPFEPYAQVVRSYFDLFLVLRGCIRATANQIRQTGPYYPDFLDPAILKQVPDGFQLIAPRGLKQREGHYFPTEIVLSRLLTRIVYLGHWAVRRQIVRWNNHPALVDEQIFAQAFNYLSPFALDGSANPDYCPYDKRSLTVLNRQPRPLQPTLCGGLLQTVVNGQLQPVEVVSDGKSQSPSYALTRRVRNGRVLWHWKAASVDREVADWFLAKLEKTFLSDDWARVVGDAHATLKQRYNECVTQLDRMEPAGKAIRLGIDHEAGADVEGVPAPAQEQEYLPLHAHLVRLAARLDMYGLTRLQQTAATALQRWEQMDSQQQRLLLAAFVSKMIVSIEHREFVLSIHWKDGSDEQLPISIHRPGGRCWSRNEITLLRQLLLARAAPAEMASAFSHRA